MALTVVLIRHGEAQNKRFGETDYDRELTFKGAEALADAFPDNLSLVRTSKASELWVSPAVRARQTADIANETLNIDIFRELKCLYEQDQQKFLEELQKTNADTVVAVGHIPFMEDMLARLTGVYMGFSTGSAAAVEIDDAYVSTLSTSPIRGRLLWYVSGPVA